MAERFRKYLCISSETSRFSGSGFTLDRFSWSEVSAIKNLSDYDGILLNLTSLEEVAKTRVLAWADLTKVFDPSVWADVLACSGRIVVVGDPSCSVPTEDVPEAKRSRVAEEEIHRIEPTPLSRYPGTVTAKARKEPTFPVQMILTVTKDNRPLDFRRVIQNSRYARSEVIYRYLESVPNWEYSLADTKLQELFVAALKKRDLKANRIELYGTTTFGTVLAIQHELTP